FLPGEIGVKEFRERHSEPALHQLGNGGDRIGDWRIGAVEINLGARQSANDTVSVGAQLEIELDFDWSTRSRPHEPDGFAASANCRVPVQRPGDRLANRG